MQGSKIPATVITGFLGAGKTTLIRNLVENANGKRIALIINEFGDLGVDGGLIRDCGIDGCRDEDVIELNNGCICCTVADDFIPTMEKLLERDDKPDHIVIETSGLALPQPLVSAFNWPGIKTRVTVDGVVTVVDSAAVAAGRFADDEDRLDQQRAADDALDHDSPIEELFEDQIEAADLIVLSKADLLDDAGLEIVRDDVRSRSVRTPKMIASRLGELPAQVLIGLSAESENDIANRRSHHEIEHANGVEHDHDDFESFAMECGIIEDVDVFAGRLRKAADDHEILRIKGFAEVAGKPMRLVVQAVGSRIDHYYDRPWRDNERRGTRLVVIGLHEMDEAAIRKALT